MREHFYLNRKNQLIRITAKSKPRKRATPYICRELINGQWVLGAFAEITWGQLFYFTYLGYQINLSSAIDAENKDYAALAAAYDC